MLLSKSASPLMSTNVLNASYVFLLGPQSSLFLTCCGTCSTTFTNRSFSYALPYVIWNKLPALFLQPLRISLLRFAPISSMLFNRFIIISLRCSSIPNLKLTCSAADCSCPSNRTDFIHGLFFYGFLCSSVFVQVYYSAMSNKSNT